MPRLRAPDAPAKPRLSIEQSALLKSSLRTGRKAKLAIDAARDPFRLPDVPPGVKPTEAGMAMDDAFGMQGSPISWAAAQSQASNFAEGQFFLGYAYLSELAQRAEYRVITETIADEMTREWIEIKSRADDNREKGDNDDGDAGGARDESRSNSKAQKTKIKELANYMGDLGIQEHCRKFCEADGFFGRGHLYIDTGDGDDPNELMTPLGNGRDKLSQSKVTKGKLKGIRTVEPIWCYPTNYNSNDPLSAEWYRPNTWYAMSKRIHRTRLLTGVGREVPDLLKPAYSFGGLSLSQMAKPYVDNWLQTRQHVADLIKSFTIFALGADLSSLLQGDGDLLFKRMQIFANLRDNSDLFLYNKETEDFKNISAPLGTLDHLQAQTQEHMAAVARIPLVKLLGIQPTGLNASSEGEIRTFYDTIRSFQNRFLGNPLRTIFDFCQLSLWGSIDEDLYFEFKPLMAPDEKTEAETDKVRAETGQVLVNGGIVSQEEERHRLAKQTGGPYEGIDPDDVPELKEEEEEGLAIRGAGGAEKAILEEGDQPDDQGGEGKPNGKGPPEREAAEDGVLPFDRAFDAEWNEEDHPRGEGGKFGKGGGGGKISKTTGAEKGQKIVAPQYGMPHGRMTAKHGEATGANVKPQTGGEYFEKNWHKAGSVGGHSQPSAKKVAKYENAYLEQGKGEQAPAAQGPALKAGELKKVGGQMGSNPGGVYETGEGKRYYVKQGRTREHVGNELAAAQLASLAGVPTLNYRAVEGGKHVATEMAKFDKTRATELSPAERKKAEADLAAHAWLANWDAVGLEHDNLGTVGGVPTWLDFGGALTYRAQGAPKGGAFGNKVTELETLRDPKMNSQAAALFAKVDDKTLKESIARVAKITDGQIRQVVAENGLGDDLADKLIARKKDLAQRVGIQAADAEPDDERRRKRDRRYVLPLEHGPGQTQVAAAPAVDEDDDPDDEEGRWLWAEDEFNESKVKRDPQGKFSSTGGGGGGAGAGEAGEQGEGEGGEKGKGKTKPPLWTPSKDLTETIDRASKVLGEPAKKGANYRYRLAQLIKEAKAGGADPLAKSLTEHLASSWSLSFADATLKGDTALAGKLLDKIDKMVGAEKANTLTAAAMKLAEAKGKGKPKEVDFGEILDKLDKEKAEAKAAFKPSPQALLAEATEQFNAGLITAQELAATQATTLGGAKYSDPNDPGVKNTLGYWLEAYKDNDTHAMNGWFDALASMIGQTDAQSLSALAAQAYKANKKKNEPKSILQKIADAVGLGAGEPKPEAPKTFPTPTPEEAKKAKKSTKMIPSNVPGAKPLEEEFDKKWAGKENLTDQQIAEKVQDFKDLKAKTEKLDQASAAEKAAIVKKQQAEQKQKQAAAAAAQAKKEAEAHAAIEKELGHLTKNEGKAFQGFASIMGGVKNAAAVLKGYMQQGSAEELKKHGISPFDYALIKSYTGSYSGQFNQPLIHGSIPEPVFDMVRTMNRGLKKMPAYQGTSYRGITVGPDVQSLYAQVGNVVQHAPLASSGKTSSFGGNLQFVMNGKSGRDINALSTYHGEKGGEVLFPSHTFFRVEKVEGKPGGHMTVHLTEVESPYD